MDQLLSSELPANEGAQRIEKINIAAEAQSMPKAVLLELRERLGKADWYTEVVSMQMELRVDEVTGLMVEKSFEYALRNDLAEASNAVFDRVAQLTRERLPSGEDEKNTLAREVATDFRARLTPSGEAYFVQSLAEIVSEKGTATPDDIIDVIQQAYLQSEMSKTIIIAGDFQKLKACNDFGEGQRPDMDGEQFVDEFGFKIWGRRMQALSVLTGSEDYQRSLQALNGTTEKVRDTVAGRKPVSEQSYLDEVIGICDIEDIRYLRDRKITITPGRREKSGDETIFVVKGESELTESDASVVDRLIKATSHVEIGDYSDQEKARKVAISQRILAHRSVLLASDKQTASLDLRIGRVKMSDEYQKTMIDIYDAAEIDGREEDPEFINEQATKRLISEAKRDMGEKKKQETLDIVFDAINGSQSAQLDLVLLIEQNRFNYRSDLLTKALEAYPADQPISREDFESLIVPEITRERRSAIE